MSLLESVIRCYWCIKQHCPDGYEIRGDSVSTLSGILAISKNETLTKSKLITAFLAQYPVLVLTKPPTAGIAWYEFDQYAMDMESRFYDALIDSTSKSNERWINVLNLMRLTLFVVRDDIDQPSQISGITGGVPIFNHVLMQMAQVLCGMTGVCSSLFDDLAALEKEMVDSTAPPPDVLFDEIQTMLQKLSKVRIPLCDLTSRLEQIFDQDEDNETDDDEPENTFSFIKLSKGKESIVIYK